MKRYTHIHGFTPESNIDYFEFDDARLRGPIAVKKDGSRVDFRQCWSHRWTKEAIEAGRWIEVMDGESPDAARRRVWLMVEELQEAVLTTEPDPEDEVGSRTPVAQPAMTFGELIDWARTAGRKK